MAHPFDPPGTQNFIRQIPEGDDKERAVCGTCGFINYVNPKIVVGAVVGYHNKILICRRAIEPRRGFWTIPAGYLEEKESTEAGARREAMEEAGADIELLGLLGVYNVPRISQVQLIYKARLAAPEFSAGPESLEVKLVTWDEMPWDELAFPTVHWALNHYRQIANASVFAPFSNPDGQTGDRMPKR